MIGRALIGIIRLYQAVSRFTPAVCRFQPTCSEYAAQAIARHGVVRGVGLALRRVVRCHPWNRGGYDPVP
ncbi:MAG: membrane protein insertion efficiency factor YidD [Capsulimonadaceae bacterium]|nr:membrane protein insertion efficiency factor YidD [Capsulimonadaceae bacterium]